MFHIAPSMDMLGLTLVYIYIYIYIFIYTHVCRDLGVCWLKEITGFVHPAEPRDYPVNTWNCIRELCMVADHGDTRGPNRGTGTGIAGSINEDGYSN